MATNGNLNFTNVNKVTFEGVGAAPNAVIDTTTGKIGVGVDSPDANLHVVGNCHVSTNMELGGTLVMGTVTVEAQHALSAITATGNTTPHTIEFQNAETSLVTTGNVQVGKELHMEYTANVAKIQANSNVVTEFSRSKKLIKYPRVALTADAETESGYNGYKVERSSEAGSQYPAWKAFNNRNDIQGNGDYAWISENAPDGYTAATGLPTGANGDVFQTVPGAWLSIELPHTIKLSYMMLSNRNDSGIRPPKDIVVWGSLGGTTWTSLKTYTNTNVTQAGTYTVDINSTSYYKHFRLHILSVHGYDAVAIGEWELFGTPEYDPDAHGTDVTVKSYPNVPNTDWLEVYYDAKGLNAGAVISPISGLGGTTISATKLGDPQVSSEAFVFDGSGDAIVSGATSLSGNPPLSYSVWFKTNSILSGTQSNSIVMIGHAAGDKSLGFRIRGTGDTAAEKYRFYVYGGATNESVDTDIKAEIGTWIHATVVYDGLNSKLYIDGKFALRNTNTSTALNLDSGAKVALGNYINSSGAVTTISANDSYDGSIANFRLFNRALTSDEIYQLYAYQKEYFGLGDLSMTLKAGRLGIGTSEPRAALDVRGRIMRAYNPGEVIEELNSICDGSTVVVQSGSYTMANITSTLTGTLTHQVITGSTINYTPPPGTKRVYYRFLFHWSALQNSGISHFRMQIDNVAVLPSRCTISGNYSDGSGHNHACFPTSVEYTIDCNTASNDASNGKFTSWTNPKELECTFMNYNHTGGANGLGYRCQLHINEWTDGASSDSIMKPHLTIRAIA
jgi:hypothetical protein